MTVPFGNVCTKNDAVPCRPGRAQREKRKSDAGLLRTPHLKCLCDLVTAPGSAVFATTTAVAVTGATAFFARLGHIHRQGSTIDVLFIEGANRGLSLFGCAHRYEPEPARTTADAIRDQIGFHHRAVGGKHILKIVFGGVEG